MKQLSGDEIIQKVKEFSFKYKSIGNKMVIEGKNIVLPNRLLDEKDLEFLNLMIENTHNYPVTAQGEWGVKPIIEMKRIKMFAKVFTILLFLAIIAWQVLGCIYRLCGQEFFTIEICFYAGLGTGLGTGLVNGFFVALNE